MSIAFPRSLRSPGVVPPVPATEITPPALAAVEPFDATRSPDRLRLDTILSGPCSTVPYRTIPLSNRPGGPLIIASPVAGLVVGCAPLDETSVLTAEPCFQSEAAYAWLAPGTLHVPGFILRPGESLEPLRRVAEHLAHPPCRLEQLVMVGAADPSFAALGRDGTQAIQWLLYRLAERAGRALLQGAAPARPWLLDREPERLARWAADLQPLLRAAGTMAFIPPGRIIAPAQVEPDPDEMLSAMPRGYSTDIPVGTTERSGAGLHSLAWRQVRARASVIDGLVTVVHAGAIVDPVDHSGVQPGVVAKRRRMGMAGVLQRTASGLLRLTRDTAFPSPTNALRVLTGTNLPGHLWQRAI